MIQISGLVGYLIGLIGVAVGGPTGALMVFGGGIIIAILLEQA